MKRRGGLWGMQTAGGRGQQPKIRNQAAGAWFRACRELLRSGFVRAAGKDC